MNRIIRGCLAAFPIALAAGGALSAASPIGTWIDHTGRGAVEIFDCNGELCGRIVWLKSAADQPACGMQIIGNAKPAAGGRWDGGWIYDPEAKSKYDVELTPLGAQKLKVFGYAGVKLFGETMTWTRAPADLRRCDQSSAATPQAPTQSVPAEAGGAEPADPSLFSGKPAREADRAPSHSESRPRKSKQCGIRIEGVGALTFPCLE
jgi:uncharacterized protein (DUF2147 family)